MSWEEFVVFVLNEIVLRGVSLIIFINNFVMYSWFINSLVEGINFECIIYCEWCYDDEWCYNDEWWVID